MGVQRRAACPSGSPGGGPAWESGVFLSTDPGSWGGHCSHFRICITSSIPSYPTFSGRLCYLILTKVLVTIAARHGLSRVKSEATGRRTMASVRVRADSEGPGIFLKPWSAHVWAVTQFLLKLENSNKMPSSDRMGVAGAPWPSKVFQRKRSHAPPSGDIRSPPGRKRRTLGARLGGLPWTRGGAWAVGAWTWVCVQPPSLPPPFRGGGRQAAAGRAPRRAWES